MDTAILFLSEILTVAIFIVQLTAAGPFTTSDNLAYEPFVELLAYARKKCPNLLVLMGPFVDRDHPHIKQGNVDKTFANIFEEQVRTRVPTL
jgi:DNA polymerase alpha subunit B